MTDSRIDGRAMNQIRTVTLESGYTKHAEGAVLVSVGDTKVLCTASVEERIPHWLKGRGSGWVTAEYAMLPRSTGSRTNRNSVNKGRALEISRLIGRSLRAVVDLKAIGERQITLDCDVLQADGGTRCAAICGAYVALHDALKGLIAKGALKEMPMTGMCAAVSAGVVDGQPMLDLCYEEDVKADVDMNVISKDDGRIIEIQGCAEKEPFSRELLNQLLDLAEAGNTELFKAQKKAMSSE